MSALFPLGQVVCTPGALDTFGPEVLLHAVARHASGDWGDLTEHDRLANEHDLVAGERLLSAYGTGGARLWVITEADRSSTCALLPSEY